MDPLLDGRPLGGQLDAGEIRDLNRVVAQSVHRHNVLRLRLRDLTGNVVFSDDGSGFGAEPEEQAVEAAQGAIVARFTHLNTDV